MLRPLPPALVLRVRCVCGYLRYPRVASKVLSGRRYRRSTKLVNDASRITSPGRQSSRHNRIWALVREWSGDMGTWGAGIFEDELSAGADVATAAKRVLDKFRYDLDDSDDGPVIYLTLAALQLEHQGL